MNKAIYRIAKTILWCLLVGAICFRLGIQQEKNITAVNEARYQTSETIAVVNLDEGTIIDGEIINYASELGTYPNNHFLGTSLDDADSGLMDGRYGAAIIISPSFSKEVESINTFPEKVSLSYEINPNLNEETRMNVTDEIFYYMTRLNDTLSYVYVSSVMDEYHGVQDDSKIILDHDINDLNNILAIKPETLTEKVEFTEIERPDYEIDFLDFSEYTEDNRELIQASDEYYEEATSRLMTKYGEIVEQSVEATSDYTELRKDIDEIDPLVMDDGTKVYDEGLEKISTTLLLHEKEQREKVEEIQTLTKLEFGYYRDKQQEFVDQQLQQLQSDNQTMVNEYIQEVLQQQLQEWYEENVLNAPTLPENVLSLNTVSLKPVVSANESNKDDNEQIWIDLTDNNVDMSLISEIGGIEEQKEIIGSENINLSEQLAEGLDSVIITRELMVNTIEEDIAKPAMDALKESLEEIDSRLDSVSVSLGEIQKGLAEFKPFDDIELKTPKENIRSVNENLYEIQRQINDKSSEDREYVSEVYRTTGETILEYKEDIKTANDATKDNVIETIDALKQRRTDINSENTDILESFSERLAYTRLGSLDNEQVYDFIVQPIEYEEIPAKRGLISEISEQDIVIYGIMIISALFLIGAYLTPVVIDRFTTTDINQCE